MRLSKKREAMEKEYYKYYYNIIKKSAKLFNEINLNDPVEISVLYEYLLWNGYFSKDKNLVYSPSGRKNNLGLVGADIMTGKSVCLNNADMLTNILQECDIEAYTIGCSVPTNKNANFQYIPDIERKKIDSSVRYKILEKIINMLPFDKIGNHAVTCFKNDKTYSVNDPTSLAFLNFNGMTKMKYVGSDMEIIFKPWIMLYLNDINTHSKFLEIMTTISSNSNLELLKLNNIRNTSKMVLDICRNNEKLLNDFHSEIYEDINGVCKTLTK